MDYFETLMTMTHRINAKFLKGHADFNVLPMFGHTTVHGYFLAMYLPCALIHLSTYYPDDQETISAIFILQLTAILE